MRIKENTYNQRLGIGECNDSGWYFEIGSKRIKNGIEKTERGLQFNKDLSIISPIGAKW